MTHRVANLNINPDFGNALFGSWGLYGKLKNPQIFTQNILQVMKKSFVQKDYFKPIFQEILGTTRKSDFRYNHIPNLSLAVSSIFCFVSLGCQLVVRDTRKLLDDDQNSPFIEYY